MLQKLKNSPYYKEAFNELSYPFGTFYLFAGYVVAEINEGVVFSWEDHGKTVTEDIGNLYDENGSGLIYITNRVEKYSVNPVGWLQYFKSSYRLKAYVIVTYSKKGYSNTLLEKLFMNANIYRYTCLTDAIEWAKKECLVSSSN
ncbi:hypothetical protein M666_03870 [Cellulophaga baltica 18]|uniref:STAS/SEC14 domain-containing protein n=1 Tax=Cellulophaga baltica 18 TaxID=1348584 RepID=A0AAU8RAC4_9FLAO|nr:hypothetical protein M666_03870 [Cellulophaga baltica 18]KGK31128.1 hypothetical protein EL45_05490 [Cellulophaga sp. E6(2014)]QXP54294.1 hypothetical protein H0I24_11920 [Cellulophaga sp. HaHa_2_1]QXP58047.1 hypothetical protein H0I25_03200 [Cellulophaga sp. HaHa_2_95]